jgi:hypothetical protein
MRLLTERIQAMIEIWTKDAAEDHGQLVNFDILQPWPNRSRPRTRRSWSAEPAGLSKTASSRSVTALVWLRQDAGGAISDSDTARFLDDVMANTRTE